MRIQLSSTTKNNGHGRSMKGIDLSQVGLDFASWGWSSYWGAPSTESSICLDSRNCVSKSQSNPNWFSNFYASITSTGSQLNFNWVSNFELKMEDPTWFWGGVEPWKPPPRHISSKRWGRLSELHYESNAKVRSSGSQVCAANVGNDLQQNIQETNHYQHHTILYQVCQVKPLFLKGACEGYIFFT